MLAEFRNALSKNKVTLFILSFIIWSYLWFCYLLCLKRRKNRHKLKELANSKQPIIFLIWHREIPLGQFCFNRKIRKNSYALISKSSDGKIISIVMRLFGQKSIKGSQDGKGKRSQIHQDKGGRQAIRQMLSLMKQGRDIVITPDGPRGPANEIKNTIVPIARRAGAKIVCISAVPTRNTHVNSWDKIIVPTPFCTINISINNEYDVCKMKGSDEEIRQEIQNHMNNL